MSSASLPSSCPHCGATPGDYSVHHQLHFCNQCGKKVATKSLPSPPAVSNRTAAILGTPSIVAASVPNPVYSTPTRPGAIVAPDEDDDVVTFKHSMQSPPPPMRIAPDVDPTPLPTRQMPRFPAAVASSSTSSLPPAPIPAASHAPIPAHAAAAPNVITLTEEEFSQLEQTIRDETKAEMKTAHDAETEILTMEFDTLSRDLQKVTQEKIELQRTMDEMMESFNKVVDDANSRKTDFTAQTTMLEAEVQQLRSTFNTQKAAFNAMKEQHTQLKAEHDERTLVSNETQAQLEKLRGEHDVLTQKYDKLHRQAQDKLSASAQEYRNLLAKNAEKDALVAQLTTDLSATRRAKNEAESALASLSERTNKLESTAETKTAEVIDLRAQLTTATSQLAETRSKFEESQAIGSRYQKQLIETREKLREAEDQTKDASKYEKDAARAAAENAALAKENQQLKSQLFDSIQIEKELKAQLDGKGGSSASAADVGRAVRLEQELNSLRATLNTKETEHKELMAICTDLISQVETLKAGGS